VEAKPEVFCANQDKLTEELLNHTSIDEFCNTKAYKICKFDPIVGGIVCNDKQEFTLESPNQSCALEPEKCNPQSSLYDECALDWAKCLRDPAWDFCNTFPTLCNIPEFFYEDMNAVGKAICASNPVFCETNGDVKSAKVICDNFDKLSDDVKYETGMLWFCEAKTDFICQDPLYS
jgi:hypothetical protein